MILSIPIMYHLFVLSLIWISIKLLIFVYKNFLRPRKKLESRYGSGSYVLVTGATDGIGKQYCLEFAKMGYNLILVSRNLEKLNSVQSEFHKKFPGIKTHVIEYDFSLRTSMKDYEEVFGSLHDYDISVLVNNVGKSKRDLFSNYTPEEAISIIHVNIIPQVLFTNILIRNMLLRKHQCAIISMSSFLATFPTVLSGMYSSSKIFNDYLSRSISYELSGKNIDFLSVRPFYVETPMTRNYTKEVGSITAEECVNGALDKLGYEEITYGNWKHELTALISEYIPIRVKNWLRIRSNKEKFS